MAESESDKWLQEQLDEVNDLVRQGSQALRQRQTRRGAQALNEAEAVLDMAEKDTEEVLKLKARVYNELGVVHQRRQNLEQSRGYHEAAAEICDQMIDGGVDFASNSAATHLNLSSILLALGERQEARSVGEKALTLLDEAEEQARDDDGEEERTPNPLQLGALQNMAIIYARDEEWESANEAMDRAVEVAETLAGAGASNYLAQLAQGCQQLSVILFQSERFEDALQWGRQAESMSEDAYEAIGQQVLPVYIISQVNLLSYYEKLGRYADGEDCLWKAIDVAGKDPRILIRGLNFYENCRKQADPRLEKGNLPREEVDDGLEDLMGQIDAAGGLEKVREQAKKIQERQRGGQS